MAGLCLYAGGALAAKLAGVAAFTLAWTHSIEKIPWEEDWRVTPAGLVLVEARVKGMGAGMEPPPEAVLAGGFWRWAPRVPPLPDVILRRAGVTADWRLCAGGQCRPMGDLAPGDADPVMMKPCDPG
ncbi:hypothetical protein GCM10007036_41130 [Alsobacter metallidurans]|uniref:DUF1850 domain-containing protein n=1 Tax=Alsobacter metallidurans TaxID=340221 RepID=A0A917MJ91_9HYPH|nr:DUF1850 domain-containing protein [Alsobacter metallidurans]GGH30500.1 hypothetical protein GCM10007036_41130 [Alsobacter metallidurans]